MALPLFNATAEAGWGMILKIIDGMAFNAYMLKGLDPGEN